MDPEQFINVGFLVIADGRLQCLIPGNPRYLQWTVVPGPLVYGERQVLNNNSCPLFTSLVTRYPSARREAVAIGSEAPYTVW